MIREYIDAAMAKAEYKTLPEGGSYYGEIPGFKGVWANKDTLEECCIELEEVLEEWLLLSISFNLGIPVVEGIEKDSFPSSRHQFMVRGDTRIRIPDTVGDDEDEDDDEIIGTELLADILRQAGISREEWEAL